MFLIPAGGGEASALTRLEPGGVRGLRWSPDGAKIAFLYRATPQAYTKKAIEERKAKGLSSPPRVHKRLGYRLDGFGYFDGSYWQVYVADAQTGEAKALTSGEFSCGGHLLVAGRADAGLSVRAAARRGRQRHVGNAGMDGFGGGRRHRAPPLPTRRQRRAGLVPERRFPGLCRQPGPLRPMGDQQRPRVRPARRGPAKRRAT